MNRLRSALWLLLGDCLCLLAVDSHQAIVYGKYYQGKAKDFTDNSYYLYGPGAPAGTTPSVKRPVIIQLPGRAWLHFAMPFKEVTPAIAEYNSKGIAYVSMGYRAIDIRYWYDSSGDAKMEELIHVSPEGKLHLDTTGKTMADYKPQFCYLELVMKAMYDAVQGLEHLIAHAEQYMLDVHRIVFFSSSAGTAEVNYLTWVYHSMHVGRFTPIGMMLENPMYDLPMSCATKPWYENWLTHSNLKRVSELLVGHESQCDWLLGNFRCAASSEAFIGNHLVTLPESMSLITQGEICNSTWNSEALKTCALLDSLTIAEAANMRNIEVSPGMQRLWSTSKNMLLHQPKPFHLYTFSYARQRSLVHSGLYGLLFAENAKRAGMNYTVYYADFMGMIAHKGSGKTRHVHGIKYNYRSSSNWQVEVIAQDKASGLKPRELVPNSLAEHSAFLCYIAGLACQSSSLPASMPDSIERYSSKLPHEAQDVTSTSCHLLFAVACAVLALAATIYKRYSMNGIHQGPAHLSTIQHGEISTLLQIDPENSRHHES